MMDYAKAITLARPGVNLLTDVAMSGDSEGKVTEIVWLIENPPTQEELESAWAQWEAGALSRAKKAAVTEVNRQAGDARSRVGTNIPFQGDVYQLKGEESFNFASDPEPNPYKYPLLYAEAQARGMELPALVAEYAYNAVMWPRILAAIEAVRMKMRVMIEAAATVGEVEAILAGVGWPV